MERSTLSRKMATKNYTKQDLKRLMQEKRTQKDGLSRAGKKIDSPLAKYDAAGQLSCVLCGNALPLKESQWTLHLASKSHREVKKKK